MSEADRERWNLRHREEGEDQPSPWLVDLDEIPRSGKALDIAGGRGRNSLWLAERGLEVTMVDVSDVGIDKAAATARERDVDLDLARIDLEHEPLPDGPWDLIICFHYLQRELLPCLGPLLVPGGLFACCIATVRNLERNPRPPREYLLELGELPALVSGLEVIRYEEGWSDGDRHEARLLARRPISRQ